MRQAVFSVPFLHPLAVCFTDGHVDAMRCSLPGDLEGRDIRSVPTEMFSMCSEKADNEGASGHVNRPSWPLDQVSRNEVCVHRRYRPVRMRRAHGTQIVAGVICGTVCVLMVVAAIYGCVHASINARYEREKKIRGPSLMAESGTKTDLEDRHMLSVFPDSPDGTPPEGTSGSIVHGYCISSFWSIFGEWGDGNIASVNLRRPDDNIQHLLELPPSWSKLEKPLRWEVSFLQQSGW